LWGGAGGAAEQVESAAVSSRGGGRLAKLRESLSRRMAGESWGFEEGVRYPIPLPDVHVADTPEVSP
jgi:hypothetical protein